MTSTITNTENLPILTTVMTEDNKCFNEKWMNKTDLTYNHIIELIKHYVGADCWAVVMNNTDVLFNSINDDKLSYREIIINNTIRNAIINDPFGSLVLHINRSKKDNCMDIYIGDNWYRVHIDMIYTDSGFKYNVIGYE